MGKPTGFLEWQRENAPKRPKTERLCDFREFALPLAPEQVLEQSGRCMNCGVPFCIQGCPLGNPIPDFNDHLHRGNARAAFAALSSTNNFPEFTGRLCPAPCEAACVLSVNHDPVTIEQLEKEIIERGFSEGWVQPSPPSSRTGRTVAVVGSGPAGLAAAAQLNRAGHIVTVFERDDAPGGLLRYGIPDFKLEKWLIDRRLAVLAAEGIEFRTGTDVGGAIGWDKLKADFDAVVIAVGSRRPRELEVPGRELRGVVQAMTYLEAQNRAVRGEPLPPELDARGRRVIILGGGDTGSDCLGTALRQAAASVEQIELMPAPALARLPGNPWPQWPMVLRTSSSHEEGGVRAFGRRTTRLIGVDDCLQALETVDVRVEDGRLVDSAASDSLREVDLLILAMGFVGPDTESMRAQLGVTLDARGNVQSDASLATNIPGVFCAGDAHRGASLIVWAIAEGREAARAADTYLTGKPSLLPARGRDQHFGGR
jgi:glutamate synthase (NADPH) small chain